MAGVVGEGADNINHWPVFSWLLARVRGDWLRGCRLVLSLYLV